MLSPILHPQSLYVTAYAFSYSTPQSLYVTAYAFSYSTPQSLCVTAYAFSDSTPQSLYVTACAFSYSKRASSSPYNVLSRFNSLFFGVLASTQIAGNLITSTVIRDGVGNISETIVYEFCGANDCPANENATEVCGLWIEIYYDNESQPQNHKCVLGVFRVRRLICNFTSFFVVIVLSVAVRAFADIHFYLLVSFEILA